jgi:hypothetical protein
MMPEELPYCICGHKNWRPGGSYFGMLSQQWFTCLHCRRVAMDLFAHNNGCFIIPSDVRGEINAHEDYINDVLLVTFLIAGKEAEKARGDVWKRIWEDFCQEHSISPDTKPTDLSPDLRSLETDKWYEMQKLKEWRCPVGFERSVTPPQIPEGLTIYLLIKGEEPPQWELVNREETLSLPLPVDPILIDHQEFYNRVFENFQSFNLERKEIPNEYCGAKNQPWYEFTFRGATFKVGPRKRVDAIKVQAPKGIFTPRIEALARADAVTFTAEHRKGSRAEELEVHAWTEEKLVEYLQTLLTQLQLEE